MEKHSSAGDRGEDGYFLAEGHQQTPGSGPSVEVVLGGCT